MSIYAEKRNGKLTGSFVIEVTEDGKRMKARAKSMAEAQAIEKDMERGRWAKPEATHTIRVTLLNLGDLILKAKLERPKAKNAWRVQNELEYVETLLGADREVETIGSKDLTELAKRIVAERKCSNATANRYVYALCGLLTWARSQDLVQRAALFTKLDEGNNQRTRWLTVAQEAQVVQWLLDHGRPAEAHCTAILGRSGLRSGELCSLTLDQVDVGAEMVTLMDQKDGTGQEGVPMVRADCEAIVHMLKAGTMPSKAVLLKHFKRAAKACGLPVGRGKDGVVIHSLRHSTATRLIQAKVNPAEVQGYMRHKSWATTQKYVKITGEQKRNALEVLANAGQNMRGNLTPQRETVSGAGEKHEQYQVVGAQGRNRTTDTAIFSGDSCGDAES
jgi:integrase